MPTMYRNRNKAIVQLQKLRSKILLIPANDSGLLTFYYLHSGVVLCVLGWCDSAGLAGTKIRKTKLSDWQTINSN